MKSLQSRCNRFLHASLVTPFLPGDTCHRFHLRRSSCFLYSCCYCSVPLLRALPLSPCHLLRAISALWSVYLGCDSPHASPATHCACWRLLHCALRGCSSSSACCLGRHGGYVIITHAPAARRTPPALILQTPHIYYVTPLAYHPIFSFSPVSRRLPSGRHTFIHLSAVASWDKSTSTHLSVIRTRCSFSTKVPHGGTLGTAPLPLAWVPPLSPHLPRACSRDRCALRYVTGASVIGAVHHAAVMRAHPA